MNRRAIALRLTLIITLAGLLPIAGVGLLSLELLRRRTERASQQGLQVIAEQVASLIEGYLAHQKELVRAVAAITDASSEGERLSELVLDAPGLGKVSLVGRESPKANQPAAIDSALLERAFAGAEVFSEVYLAKDTTPAMDLCTPARALPGHVVCASLDLLELWRLVQRIHIGQSGYAVAFDAQGRVLASGVGTLRSAILSKEQVSESPYARLASMEPRRAPVRYLGPDGEFVLAAWARLPQTGGAVVVEQPIHEVRRTTRAAQLTLTAVLILTLLLSFSIGLTQSQRLLGEFEVEERWRTAGRIAAGITHDLGHRLRVLQQTAALADADNPSFLPQIGENLRAELATLKKFVKDFSDLSRDVGELELFPLELSAFLESIRRTSAPQAEVTRVTLEVQASQLWVEADRHLLERALLNLVSNAIEASPPGSTVLLRAEATPEGCALHVSDQGAGISPERLPTLFDAFVSTKKTGAHLGMGLPNVKRIVEAHDGAVAVESKLGKGTTFHIHLSGCAAPGDREVSSRAPRPPAKRRA